MTNQSFIGDPAAVRSAVVGSQFTLSGSEAHHAATVKRVKVGETLDVVDGGGNRVSGTVTSSSPAAVVLTVDSLSYDPPPSCRFVLVQALAKSDRAELAVEAATELGIDAVLPWQADRSIVRWRGDKAVKGRQKWESLVRAASKQSRRTRTPEVLEPLDSKGLAAWLKAAGGAIVLHEGASVSLAEYWAGGGAAHTDVIAVVVGPEGGISPQEVELFVSSGAVPVSLGSNVLRASTAGPAAVAVLNHLTGRW